MPLANPEVLLVQLYFPGMRAEEVPIARAWLARHYQEWDEVRFNVRLGEGVPPPPGATPEIERMVAAGSRKRADLIVFRPSQVGIVEIEVRINPSVLGQLIVYRDLYRREDPLGRPIRLIAAGRTIVPDIEVSLRNGGIEVELFPDA